MVPAMGILQLLDDLPTAVTRPPAQLWSVLARSLGEQGATGRTALAWRWALTGACPSPVTLATPATGPPDRREILDEVKANTPLTGRRYPASRIVLPPAAAVDLINRMQQIAAALTQAGMVKAAPRPGDVPKAG